MFKPKLFSQLFFAVDAFKRQRADYYEYLADMMEATAGRRTLRDMFLADESRYKGMFNPRRILAAHWRRRFEDSGGDIGETFEGTLPEAEVALLRAAQEAGAGALELALRDAAALARLVDTAKGTFIKTVFAAAVAGVLCLAVWLGAIPYFTAPSLQETFAQVPTDQLGPHAQRLYGYAQAVRENMLVIAVSTALLVYGLLWSVRHYVGPGRSRMDKWFIWRIYRDFEAIRFLASLATLIKQRGNVSTQLRDALDMLLPGSAAWTRKHIAAMIRRIDQGQLSAETFDTGMLDNETLWFLTDLIEARGMDKGLLKARDRLSSRTLDSIAKKAAVVRWALLLLSVFLLLGAYAWQGITIIELKDSYLNAVASF